MASTKARAEKEREKQVQDKVQAILGAMLKDEDNKYCVDCDSKGPRWASWNLGIFLCIRCAGIHRNLGVHISRVKSVNLDSWKPKEVASMQQMGNSKARAVYEANLPDGYRRPAQNDQAMEAFIRQKYEKRKYIAAEWSSPATPEFPAGWDEAATPAQAHDRKPEFKKLTVPAAASAKPAAAASPKPAQVPVKQPPAQPPPVKAAAAGSVARSASTLDTDLLGLSLGAAASPSAVTSSSSANDLLGLNSEFGGFESASPAPAAVQSSSASVPAETSPKQEAASCVTDGKMSKDSIMALFGPKASPAPASAAPVQNFAAPNLFGAVPQQQQPQQQQFGAVPLQQQFGSFGSAPQQPQQSLFGQFQSPSAAMFLPQQPQQQQQSFLGGSSFGLGQVNPSPAFNPSPIPQQNNVLDIGNVFNSKPGQTNNSQAPANNPFLDSNQLNGRNGLAATPSLWQ